MSVQSEINRISGNVTAALAAIAEKGVTVDSGSNSDDLATLIAAIEAGGGGGMQMASGEYAPASNVTLPKSGSDYVTIPTGTDFYPRMFFIWEESKVATSSSSTYAFHFGCGFVTSEDLTKASRKGTMFSMYYADSPSTIKTYAHTKIGDMSNSGLLAKGRLNGTFFTMPMWTGGDVAYLFAGRTYKWLVIGDPE